MTKVTFVVDQIAFKVASVADISLLVTEITFVVGEIIIKEDVITSYLAKITFIVAVKWLWSLLPWPRSFL